MEPTAAAAATAHAHIHAAEFDGVHVNAQSAAAAAAVECLGFVDVINAVDHAHAQYSAARHRRRLTHQDTHRAAGLGRSRL